MISNQSNFLTALKHSLQIAQLHNHRVLLVLVGDTDQHLAEVCALFSGSNSERNPNLTTTEIQTETPVSMNIMHLPDRHSNSDNSDQINTLLGTEHKCVIFDAYDAFNERLFAACAGTILAGGLLVLRTPHFHQWAQRNNNVDNNNADPSNFINRIVNKIRHHQIHELCDTSLANDVACKTTALLIGDKEPSDVAEKQTSSHNWESIQNAHIKQLLNELATTRHSAVVVQADRGRGKSSLIGRAFNQLLNDKNHVGMTIAITASRQSACDVLMQHACKGYGNQCSVKFIPLDIATNMQHDLLMVEEAGSISIPVLTKLTKLSKNIVFATTVQGYEGAGRGFALRFSKLLDRLRPDWIKLEPEQPIRWSPNDPLEAFINDALLLKTTLPKMTQVDALTPSAANLTQVDKHELSTNERLLEEVYALLVQAHYQTTPADLRHMIDQEKMLVFVQHTNELLTGAALIALEGDIPVKLHQEIVEKRRRLPDQILPQLLAQCAAERSVLPLRYARVVRVAVHPSLHRRGFGTALFKQLRKQLHPLCNQIGTSFGADQQSLSYWLKLGLTPIHYGYKANPRSGLRSACLMMGSDSEAVLAIEKAMSILHENLRALEEHGSAIDQVREQLIDASKKSGPGLSTMQKNKLLNDFCQSHRSFIDTVGFIQQDVSDANTEIFEHHLNCLLKQREQQKPSDRRVSEQAIRAILAKRI